MEALLHFLFLFFVFNRAPAKPTSKCSFFRARGLMVWGFGQPEYQAVGEYKSHEPKEGPMGAAKPLPAPKHVQNNPKP